MYEHILISTDGSDVAQKGVECGLDLAKSLRAKVTILTVTERLGHHRGTLKWDPASGERPGYEDSLSQDEIAGETLASAQATARRAGVAARTLHVRDACPADAIIGAAQAEDCQLIVMASHGRTGLGRVLLGSQTSAVLARSSIPVLVVR
ncbi:universal stress protein [Caenibius sp. WL]|uniref:universal stress protein n=1 Tax=Caenibius sp. WL TaxID=2872646 RepID=UPI001C990873|nr:universal stress protein [Caenibius sp. WL]QZP08128.1 universal stress protein [Caenibius sp. WL]